MTEEQRIELELVNEQKQLSEVQKYMLDMLKQLLEIFKEHRIHYYMIGGTLIGAVRHKGFIPWDDDIDLAIPRMDYDRFISELRDELPEHLELRTYNDGSYHHYYFARVVDTRYKILREGSLKGREEELWIDLFPLDGLPKNRIKCAWHKFRLLSLKTEYHFATFDKLNLMRPNRPLYQRAIIKAYMLWPFKTKKNYVDILDKIDKQLKKVPLSKSYYAMEFMGSTIPFRETIAKWQYGKGKLFDFEGMKIKGPLDSEYYLTHVYGDYMSLPPEDKRNYHAATFIKNDGVEE